jgi:hypothetical protein
MALGFSATTDYSGWLNSADICSYYATWRATGANGVTFQAGSTSSSPSTPVQSAGTLSTSWQRYSYTLLVPTNTKTIVCGVYSEATLQNGGIDVTGIQFESGTAPSTFDRRHIQQELAMCQRYYEVLNYSSITSGYSLMSAPLNVFTNQWLHWTFSAQKRVVPTVGFVTGGWSAGTGTVAAARPSKSFAQWNHSDYFYGSGAIGALAQYADAEI